jgi:AcrR family transcriptional regulator
MPVKPRPSARQKIFEAAEQVVRTDGAANLTLEAVAAAAGVSKGGLLYHFASKEALLKGMVDRHMDEHDSLLVAACARHPDTPGGYMRAYLEAQFESAKKDIHEAAAARSFLAAAANFPALLERPRKQATDHFARLRQADTKFPLAALLSLALDGLFFADVYELGPLTEAERVALTDELLKLADQIDAD